MKNVFDFDAVIDRAKKSFKINDDKELAEFIGMKPNAFYNRKKAQSLPYEELLKAADTENVSFNWLLTGEGSMYKNEVRETPPAYGIGNRRLQMMMQLMDSLTDRQQEEILLAIEDKERFNKLERQMGELTARLSA